MPSRLYVLLGKQVAFFRRKAGLTQEELAERTGYSVDFIGLVERGINAPTVERLGQVADVLGVEVWQLFKLTHSPTRIDSNPQKRGKKSRGSSGSGKS